MIKSKKGEDKIKGKKWKTLLRSFIGLLLITGFFYAVFSPLQVKGMEQSSGDFEIENGKLIKYTGDASDVTIPESVTNIGTDAFSYCNKELIIYGKKDSYVEEYAKTYDITFEIK